MAVKRTTWQTGDFLIRFERHPRTYFSCMFAFLWGTLILGLHFVPRSYDGGPAHTMTWGGAMFVGLIVASVGITIVYWMFRRA